MWTDIAIVALIIAAVANGVAIWLCIMFQWHLRELDKLLKLTIQWVQLGLFPEIEIPVNPDNESAVVDARETRRKKEERRRKGEEPDDSESQIVTVKTRAEREAEADAAKEGRLDKWMPGVKHDK